MIVENYYINRKNELQQEATKLKIRHSDKVYNLSAELQQDLSELIKKLQVLEAQEKDSKQAGKKPVAKSVVDKND